MARHAGGAGGGGTKIPGGIEARMRVYAELGIRHFMLWFMDAPASDGLRLFADAVLPRFRC